MDNILKKELVEYLKTFVSKQRLQLFDEKLNLRTRSITLVLEDVFQSRNIKCSKISLIVLVYKIFILLKIRTSMLQMNLFHWEPENG